MKNPIISKQFKQDFNNLVDEINVFQTGRGRLTLPRKMDIGMSALMESVIKVCERYAADQATDPVTLVDFMGICREEY